MTRNIFGWSLPPGVSHHMIEAAYDTEGHPCDVCGNLADSCICPECPVCTAHGDKRCYDGGYSDGVPHGLRRSPEQIANHLAMQRAPAAEQSHCKKVARSRALSTNSKPKEGRITERDDDEALMPDGSRVPWDERLRMTDGARVPKVSPEAQANHGMVTLLLNQAIKLGADPNTFIRVYGAIDDNAATEEEIEEARKWTTEADSKTTALKPSPTKQLSGTHEPDEIVGLLSVCRTAITEQWDTDHADTIALIERIDNVLGPIADTGGESVLRVLDVSAGHLRAAERGLLECGELPGQTHTSDFGGMVSTGPFGESARDVEAWPDGASATLVAIMREGVRRHCSYVNFDADAGTLAGFPTFDDDDNPETV